MASAVNRLSIKHKSALDECFTRQVTFICFIDRNWTLIRSKEYCPTADRKVSSGSSSILLPRSRISTPSSPSLECSLAAEEFSLGNFLKVYEKWWLQMSEEKVRKNSSVFSPEGAPNSPEPSCELEHSELPTERMLQLCARRDECFFISPPRRRWRNEIFLFITYLCRSEGAGWGGAGRVRCETLRDMCSAKNSAFNAFVCAFK